MTKWPFLLGDGLLLVVAYWIVNHSPNPFDFWPLVFLVLCVAGGACLVIYPFVADFKASLKFAESQGLHEAVAKINEVSAVAASIGHATSQWQDIQNQATQTQTAARNIADQMATEAKAFADFMQKANDTEKSHLRLEVDKLRRMENDWLQTLVLLMDHVYGIYSAAKRSGKQAILDQLSQYQRACREVVRRIGLVPFEVPAGETYQVELHQLADPEAALPQPAIVQGTLATGYKFQGQVIRKPLVSLQENAPPTAAKEAADLFSLPTQEPITTETQSPPDLGELPLPNPQPMSPEESPASQDRSDSSRKPI